MNLYVIAYSFTPNIVQRQYSSNVEFYPILVANYHVGKCNIIIL